MLRTPLFLAINSMNNHRSPGDLAMVHCITKAILSSKRVDLSERLEKDEELILGKLIRQCCNGDIITDLVNAGLSYLP